MYDVIVAGGGPAGLTSAMYAARGGLKTLVFEKFFVGGQAATTFEIENYPGFAEAVTGPGLAFKMEAQAKKFGAEVIYEEILEILLLDNIKRVRTSKAEYEARFIILAMGANPRMLGLEREEQLRGAGVSYCATCDGALYKGKDVAVVGGGNTASSDALFLSRFVNKVYLIHRRDKLRADKVLVDKIRHNDKIEIIWDSVVTKIEGVKVEGLMLQNVKDGGERKIDVSGLFVAVGTVPESRLASGAVEMTEDGYIITDEEMKTNIKNVYAIGDIRKKTLRQVITAAADGAVAAYEITQGENL